MIADPIYTFTTGNLYADYPNSKTYDDYDYFGPLENTSGDFSFVGYFQNQEADFDDDGSTEMER